MHTLEATIPAIDTHIHPLELSSMQLRSISRNLANAGRPCKIHFLTHGDLRYPLFIGVTAAEVIAVAHMIPSLATRGWMKVALAEVKPPEVEGPAFCSALLICERKRQP